MSVAGWHWLSERHTLARIKRLDRERSQWWREHLPKFKPSPTLAPLAIQSLDEGIADSRSLSQCHPMQEMPKIFLSRP